MKTRWTWTTGWVSLVLLWALRASAAPVVDTVKVDLNPLIDAAVHSPQQFAVTVHHPISISSQGIWARHGSTSTWTYAVRIPTAISMSFHAPQVLLPPSAVLTVSSARTTSKFVARDISRSGLWGRPMPGDTLNFSLSVDSSEATRVHFQIDNLQAGYRSLGGGVPNHPHYEELQRDQTASTNCTVNYECQVTTGNQGPAHASVAILIGNLYQCSGTLLNDTSGDGAPYVLTARHCESGTLGGGNPDAAATVTVYWDAVTPCGGDLGSLYDSSAVTQTGATTVLEQQDIWLILLDAPPAAADAFYAGWDASGQTFAGGYTIHYALGGDQQYVEWSGTDIALQIPGATLGIPYDSNFWGVVNGLGNVGAGASGSGLFTPNNLLAGSASLASLTAGAGSSGICPANPPPTPTAASATALFTAVSGVWTSTADPTSSTATRTLKSLLDPGSTGQLTISGVAKQPITLTASTSFANTGTAVTLTWNVQGAESCTAWGGVSGDGWAGAEPASGSVQLTEAAGGPVNYSLSCQVAGQIGSGTATVTWNYIEPLVNLTGGSSGPQMLGATTTLNWDSNVSPCVATGGISGQGWSGTLAASGSFPVTVTQTGLTPYTLTCGTAPRTATSTVYVYGVSPAITLVPDVAQIRVGSYFQLSWFGNGYGGTCAASGGSGTDGWAANNGHVTSNGSTLIFETTAGTYTYTLTCTGGGQSTSSDATVTVTNDSAAISLSAIAPEQQVFSLTGNGPAPLNLLWTSNVSGCSISYTTNSGLGQAIVLSGGNPSGAVSDAETQPGLVTYTMQCGSLQASTTINWVTTAVPNALSVSSNSWATNVAYPVSWNGSASPCVASGGSRTDGWAGSKAQAGTQSVTESQPGAYVFTLVCGATTSQIAVTVPPASIQIYSSQGTSPITSLPYTNIVWSSTVGPCTYLDGSAADSTGIAVAPSGSATPTPATSGTYLFSLTCGSGASTVYAGTLAQISLNQSVTLTTSANSAAIYGPVTLSWTSPANSICYALGGTGTAPWTGTLPGSGSGSLIVTSDSAGAVTYEVNCDNETASVSVTYAVPQATTGNAKTPTATLSATAGTENVDQSFALTWSSTSANACSASGGDAGDGWSGSLAPSGSMNITETSAGTVNYSITCSGGPPAATAVATVVIRSTMITAGPPSHGGGGSMDFLLIFGLGLGVLRRVASIRLTSAS
ncbi:MAG: hypothetical protein WBE91_10890 [Steroidobacteraceae bacterium]